MNEQITQEEIQEIERLTGGKIGTHTFGQNNEHTLVDDDYWSSGEWKQPSVKIKHGDLVDIKCENYPIMLGRYIGKGLGVVELYNYSTGISYHIGKVMTRGLDRNPRLVSDEKLFEFIED